jgi:outer membrane protein W
MMRLHGRAIYVSVSGQARRSYHWLKMELNKRNTEAFNQSLKNLTHMVLEQEKKIMLQSNAIAGISIRITEIENDIKIRNALSAGNGPSVK